MKIRQQFFTRQGGVSTGIYASLNCGLGSRDGSAHIHENRNRVVAAMGGGTLLNVYQVHGNACVTVSNPWPHDAMPKADAMATDRPGILLGILTADCGPVLFQGVKAEGAPVIGAAHAGWGGAVGGVLENTITAMIDLGAIKNSIEAMIGPCIALDSYEVSDGFERPFLAHNHRATEFFRSGRLGHQHFNLPGYLRFRLENAGIGGVIIDGRDTCADEKNFYSYRRATLRDEADYGRQISVIIIEADGYS